MIQILQFFFDKFPPNFSRSFWIALKKIWIVKNSACWKSFDVTKMIYKFVLRISVKQNPGNEKKVNVMKENDWAAGRVVLYLKLNQIFQKKRYFCILVLSKFHLKWQTVGMETLLTCFSWVKAIFSAFVTRNFLLFFNWIFIFKTNFKLFLKSCQYISFALCNNYSQNKKSLCSNISSCPSCLLFNSCWTVNSMY